MLSLKKNQEGKAESITGITGIHVYKYVTMHVQCKLILCTATCIC